MSVLGRAVAQLSKRHGGQVLLELPDDLPLDDVATLVRAATGDAGAGLPFALLVQGDSLPSVEGITCVDYRELAQYREGNRLAVTYASQNRGMATYTSVYKPLFTAGFPGNEAAARDVGLASLDGLSSTIAEILTTDHGMSGGSAERLKASIVSVAEFLALAYQEAGNGQATLASDWWIHVQVWLVALQREMEAKASRPITATVYGCAGLPVPDEGRDSLRLAPRDYLRILGDRWANPEAIERELSRLRGIPSAVPAADKLGQLEWEAGQTYIRFRTDSPPAGVALVGSKNMAALRVDGWSLLSEHDFSDSFTRAKGKIILEVGGVELPCPWSGSDGYLIVEPADCGDSDAEVRLSEACLIVPWDMGHGPDDIEPNSITLEDVTVTGSRGCDTKFRPVRAEVRTGGVAFLGTLELSPARRTPNLGRITVEVGGRLGAFLANRSDCTLVVVYPGQVAVVVRPETGGKSARRGVRGPVFWDQDGNETTPLALDREGLFEIALAGGAGLAITRGNVAAGGKAFEQQWPVAESEGLLLGEHSIAGDLTITVDGRAAFTLEPGQASDDRPLSPLIAAALGTSPRLEVFLDNSNRRNPSVLGQLEELLHNELPLGAASPRVLGGIVVGPSDTPLGGDGFLVDPSVQAGLGTGLPGVPPNELVESEAYQRLRNAYGSLRLVEHSRELEDQAGTGSLTISRFSLDHIEASAVNELLSAYLETITVARGLGDTAILWARHPYSVMVLQAVGGGLSLDAILLSPLHPIRLAWMWALQVGLLGSAQDTDQDAVPSALQLLDAAQFPAILGVRDGFDEVNTFLPVPIDPSPEDVYLGWSALVRVAEHKYRVPKRILGQRFPIDGLSALSDGAVASSVEDFLRVSPEVQSLRLELASSHPVPRSPGIDSGILSKIEDLALNSASLDGVSGITILDSTHREGPPPPLGAVRESFTLGRPGFNVQWLRMGPGETPRFPPHVSFLEGVAALVGGGLLEEGPSGWLPELPLRRFPYRERQRPGRPALLDYSLDADTPSESLLAKAIAAYELHPSGQPQQVMLQPDFRGLPGRPRWLVTGDLGIDPTSIMQAARSHAGDRYLLWDWRPATAVRRRRSVGGRSQAYYVMAAVPSHLSRSIRERIKKLNDSLPEADIDARCMALMGTLAERAIGLNTLLSIGHHQATGALGFYFALKSLATWIRGAPESELRLVIPVDAVDPFLREATGASATQYRKRADLMAVVASLNPDAVPRVILIPIEIKHYGLHSSEAEQRFPGAEEARLQEHVRQLTEYSEQLAQLCSAYEGAATSRASILGQQIAAVIEAAAQLHPTGLRRQDMRVIRALERGDADLALGRGILLWYQARARVASGRSGSVEVVDGTLGTRRVHAWIDPVASDDGLWGTAVCEAHEVLAEALQKAVQADGTRPEDSVQDVSPSDTMGEVEDIPPAPLAGGTTPRKDPLLEGSVGGHDDPGGAEGTLPGESPSPRDEGKLDGAELSARYAKILGALNEFKVKVLRPDYGGQPYQEGPSCVQYFVRPAYGTAVSKIERQLENIGLRLALPSGLSVGSSTHKGSVILTVPKTDEERYFIDAREMWNRWSRPHAGLHIPLGEAVDGTIVAIELSSSNSPHLLIGGATGSGKSEALLTLLRGAIHFYRPDEIKLRLIDPKRVELAALSVVPHADRPIGFTPADALALLHEAVEEMERRYSQFLAAGVKDIDGFNAASSSRLPRWLIVLDEYADLTTDRDDKKAIESEVGRLSQKARAAGIHLVVSTQKPVVDVIGTVIKGNLPGRIALRVSSLAESGVVLDEPGAELLVGKGDALVKVAGRLIRVQFARFTR